MSRTLLLWTTEFGRPGGDLVPLDVRLWIAVQQQRGRTSAAVNEVDRHAVRRDPGFCEAFKHGHRAAVTIILNHRA